MAKILLIDDEPYALEVLAKLLKANGYNAVSACGGEEGLVKAKQEKPDLILLDILMPGMNGHEVIKCLKKDDVTKAIPVIMVSAREDFKFGTESLSKVEGAAGYVNKPIRLESLLPEIKKVLQGE